MVILNSLYFIVSLSCLILLLYILNLMLDIYIDDSRSINLLFLLGFPCYLTTNIYVSLFFNAQSINLD